MNWIKTFLFLSVFVMCNNTPIDETKHEKEKELQPATNSAYTQLKLDSTIVENYMAEKNIDKEMSNNIRSFYSSRNYQYGWINEKGFPEHTQALWNRHIQYINLAGDSSVYDQQLHSNVEDLLTEDFNDWGLSAEQVRDLELQLTEHFFDYAKTAYTSNLNPKSFNWHIPARKLNLVTMLDSFTNKETNDPVLATKQYMQLKEQILKYREIMENHSAVMNSTMDMNRIYKPGDSSEAITRISEKLKVLGDLEFATVTGSFNSSMEAAVKTFQQRHGLVADGVIGPRFLAAFNHPASERIKQLLINLERLKWMPAPYEGTHLVANIPSFTLHVYESEEEQFSMPIVVGKAATRSVIFNDKLEYVVFSPYWNIPRSIVKNEIVPAMRSDRGYLSRNNMEVTGNSNGLPVIRQKPGPGNALGKVKFIFPNRYNIYFHDTPAKSLFDRNKRAFSHGCIRLEQPFRLASYLLQDKGWDESRIRSAMNAGSEKWVRLDNKIPVLISYLTAWVDASGKLQFRDDIYGHDRRLKAEMFDN